MKRVSFFLFLILTMAVPAATNDSPSVVSAVAPPYPDIARAAHLGGDVFVDVVIDREGKVTSSNPTGHPLLVAAAKWAATQWRFAPANDSGKRTATLTFTFTAMPPCTDRLDLTTRFSPPYKIEVRVETPPAVCMGCSPAEQEKIRCKMP